MKKNGKITEHLQSNAKISKFRIRSGAKVCRCYRFVESFRTRSVFQRLVTCKKRRRYRRERAFRSLACLPTRQADLLRTLPWSEETAVIRFSSGSRCGRRDRPIACARILSAEEAAATRNPSQTKASSEEKKASWGSRWGRVGCATGTCPPA